VVLGQGRGQNLDRHVAPECGVLRAIDLAYPARADGTMISWGPRRVPGARVMSPRSLPVIPGPGSAPRTMVY
jgi:hypothetical protein